MEFTEEFICYVSELFKPLTFSFIGTKALNSTLQLKVIISEMPGNFRGRLLLVFIFSFHVGLFPKDSQFESTVTCCHEAEWQDFNRNNAGLSLGLRSLRFISLQSVFGAV